MAESLRFAIALRGEGGQTHFNSDVTIADEGRPQGAPLPIVFSRRYALRRAPTRGAPTNSLLSAFCPEKGVHKGCPRLSSFDVWPWEGHPQGVPFYQLSSLGVLPWEGHPQGVPLPIVFSRRLPWEGRPQGAPLPIVFSRRLPWEGRPQGVPLPIVFSRHYALGRAPTRGAPTDCLLSTLCPGKGAHKGCPYRLSSLDIMPWEGRPQGVPPIVFFRRLALGRAPTRGAPTDCLLSTLCPGKGAHKGCPRLSSRAFGPGKGTHKGCPYRLSSLGVWP